MSITLQTIITAVSTLCAWLISKKWLLPYIVKAWEWLKERKHKQDNDNIDATKELTAIKKESNEVYESQIKFLTTQVEHLENELLQFQNQLEILRKKILELNQKLFHKSMLIDKLKNLCCKNKHCKMRIYCDDSDFCITTNEVEKNEE